VTTSGGFPPTPRQRPPLRRGAKEAIIALAALPVLLVAGIYLGGRIGSDSPTSLQPAAGAADTPTPLVTVKPHTPVPVVTVKPATPGPVATVTPAAPGPVVTVKPATPAPQVTVRPPAPTTPAPAPPAAPDSSPAVTSDAGPMLGPVAPTEPPPVPAVVLRRGSSGADVRAWQQQMARRTWRIRVDGLFGPESERVARTFQQHKGLRVDGVVGRQTWAAAWRLPVRL
jgi:hypothetical protein